MLSIYIPIQQEELLARVMKLSWVKRQGQHGVDKLHGQYVNSMDIEMLCAYGIQPSWHVVLHARQERVVLTGSWLKSNLICANGFEF